MTARRSAILVAAVTLLGGSSARPPSLLTASATFLIYAEGDRRHPAVARGGGSFYRLIGATPDGSALVTFDEGAFTNVETIAPSLGTRTIKTFPRGTAIFRGTDGFVAYESNSQLARRYDTNGNLVGTPIAALGVTELLGLGDAVAGLGNGRLRIWDRNGRMQREALLDGNALVPLPNNRFAVNDVRDSEVREYTTTLEQTATLRYVGLPARTLASAPDGALAVLAGTPACTPSNAEVDVFTDLHAQPTARIHENLTNALRIAIANDYVFVALAPCQSGQDGAVAVFSRDGTSHGLMNNLGTPTSLLPFAAQH